MGIYPTNCYICAKSFFWFSGALVICPECQAARQAVIYPPTSTQVDNINHPSHYNSNEAKCDCGRRIECIDITRHMSFNIGNATKYLWRQGLKNDAVEDLKKAIWYIEDEIKFRVQSLADSDKSSRQTGEEK